MPFYSHNYYDFVRLCGNKITGIASESNGGKYFYYHCQHGCKERFKADLANDEIVKKFGGKTPNMGVPGIQGRVGKPFKIEQRKKLIAEIERAKNRIANARNTWFDIGREILFENNSYRTIPFRKVITLICRTGKV